MRIADQCAIVGIGNTAYTRGTEWSTVELHLEASLRALADAGLTPADVDAVLPSATAGRCAEDFIANLGLRDLAFSSTEHVGGSSFISPARKRSSAAAGVSQMASTSSSPIRTHGAPSGTRAAKKRVS